MNFLFVFRFDKLLNRYGRIGLLPLFFSRFPPHRFSGVRLHNRRRNPVQNALPKPCFAKLLCSRLNGQSRHDHDKFEHAQPTVQLEHGLCVGIGLPCPFPWKYQGYFGRPNGRGIYCLYRFGFALSGYCLRIVLQQTKVRDFRLPSDIWALPVKHAQNRRNRPHLVRLVFLVIKTAHECFSMKSLLYRPSPQGESKPKSSLHFRIPVTP